jgi:hypothetical protein
MPGSAPKFLHHLRPHLSRNTFNSLTMRFDFVVGEGYCTRFVDGGRLATDRPGRSDHQPSRNVSGTAVSNRDPPICDFFQKKKAI